MRKTVNVVINICLDLHATFFVLFYYICLCAYVFSRYVQTYCRIVIYFLLILPTDDFVSVFHSVKSVRIRSFSDPYFPAFGPNTERYEVFFRIQFQCGNIRTRNTSNTDTFHAVFVAS